MKKRVLLTVAMCLALGLTSFSGCASDGGGGGGDAQAKASPYAEAPADSKLAKVQLDMNDAAVRKILGDPDSSNAYMTGKAWIPFYYGPDTHRTDWMYRGQGRVVFSRNRYTAGLKVIKILYNPSELQ